MLLKAKAEVGKEEGVGAAMMDSGAAVVVDVDAGGTPAMAAARRA